MRLSKRQSAWLFSLALLSLSLTMGKALQTKPATNDALAQHPSFYNFEFYDKSFDLASERTPRIVYATLLGVTLAAVACLCLRNLWGLILSLPLLLLAMTVNAVWVWIVRQVAQMSGSSSVIEPDAISACLQLSLAAWFLTVAVLVFKAPQSRRQNQLANPA